MGSEEWGVKPLRGLHLGLGEVMASFMVRDSVGNRFRVGVSVRRDSEKN